MFTSEFWNLLLVFIFLVNLYKGSFATDQDLYFSVLRGIIILNLAFQVFSLWEDGVVLKRTGLW